MLGGRRSAVTARAQCLEVLGVVVGATILARDDVMSAQPERGAAPDARAVALRDEHGHLPPRVLHLPPRVLLVRAGAPAWRAS